MRVVCISDMGYGGVREDATLHLGRRNNEGLLGHMLRNHIGVREERKLEILELDQNYFNDEN